MKFITTNFLKCPIKTCDVSNDNYPLQYNGEKCELQQENIEYKPEFLIKILDRLDWEAVLSVAQDLGNTSLPSNKPQILDDGVEKDAILRDLHTLLLQTNIVEGEMKCKNCGHVYYIKNSIPNLLLPPHLA
ncbi:probable Multifunctional methyltransferase subunit TRM112 [Saccharomycodes ludwigii]|uniref:Multifunctional methyltransferase subunit trm112 n=1 Tax=Saccharomycodes ludwigii TaxID=36035 RepID=A0A376B2V9_9ASCO|nr:hypothetical protein SCDLUD_003771 [Saccharomycodes ludwigii]KAH3900766.1 hypothetical protein SCDLUD_003771 [Saccharomycodes ludwigii]SSD58929.1 probable Multifunctional methyltransferase subunit TRM112 [Saccharomycodes ludwigii]